MGLAILSLCPNKVMISYLRTNQWQETKITAQNSMIAYQAILPMSGGVHGVARLTRVHIMNALVIILPRLPLNGGVRSA